MMRLSRAPEDTGVDLDVGKIYRCGHDLKDAGVSWFSTFQTTKSADPSLSLSFTLDGVVDGFLFIFPLIIYHIRWFERGMFKGLYQKVSHQRATSRKLTRPNSVGSFGII